MGKDWDGHKGGRDKWIAWLRDILAECRRVMKPGAYGWVWALPRTSHWTATACEDAGFAVRDVLAHVFGTGFPKSRSLLKPASEHWILIKAPGELRELRIEENRIGTEVRFNPSAGNKGTEVVPIMTKGSEEGRFATGRWPANFALSHDDDCKPVGTRKVKTGVAVRRNFEGGEKQRGFLASAASGPDMTYGDADGTETVEAWQCVDGCPVKALDEQSGTLKSGSMGIVTRKRPASGILGTMPAQTKNEVVGDSGTASRFFYVAKPSTRERSAGLPEGTRNTHVTVKATALMQHLISLIAAPGDLVLDPFAGSGTTGIAAVKQGCRFVGIEHEAEHVEIARQRIAFAVQSV
jgi:site-specific DNA-methyltransferase (adenine-specific)